jgi:hypothetical protein
MDTAAAGRLVISSSSLFQTCQDVLLPPAEFRFRYDDLVKRVIARSEQQ